VVGCDQLWIGEGFIRKDRGRKVFSCVYQTGRSVMERSGKSFFGVVVVVVVH